jgi:hypothetical protein
MAIVGFMSTYVNNNIPVQWSKQRLTISEGAAEVVGESEGDSEGCRCPLEYKQN